MLLRKHSSLYWGFDVCYLVLPNEFVMLPGDLSVSLFRTVKDSKMRSKHCQTLNLGISDAHSQFVSFIPFGTCDGQLRAMIPLSCPAALPAALPSLYFSSTT